MTDVFQVQAEVAGKVAQALGVALSTGEHDSLAVRPTQNLAAYNAYLQGTSLLHEAVGEPEAHRRAVVALRQATSLDSGFAQAWAALAVGESRMYEDGTTYSLPDSAIGAAAQAHAERAIALAPRLAAAHWALAVYYDDVVGDRRRALVEDSLALQLTPNDVDVLRAMGSAELALQHGPAAVVLFQRAQTLDPRSLPIAAVLSAAFIASGRYAEATAAIERGLQLDPTRVGLLRQLSVVRLLTGDSTGARAALDRVLAVEPTNLGVIEGKARSYLFFGDLSGARSVVTTPPPGVDPDALIAYMAVTFDLYWVLDDAQQQRLFTMPASTFNAADGGNPRDRPLALAHTAWLRGDTLRARMYADSSFPFAVAMVRRNPTNADAHGLLADVEASRGQAGAMAADTASFELEAGEVEIFPKTNVIFLGLRGGVRALHAMHAAMNAGALAFDEPFEYHPHITLAQEFEAPETARLAALARERWAAYTGPRTFLAETVAFVQNTEGNCWLDLAVFELGTVVGKS